jgi:hypothetical protein
MTGAVMSPWELVTVMCEEYITAFLHGDQSIRYHMEKHVRRVMEGQYGAPPAEVFEALLNPVFFSERELAWCDPVGEPVVLALANPNCPQYLLAVAAGCTRQTYNEVARTNPNCPEEHEVYAALWRNRNTS